MILFEYINRVVAWHQSRDRGASAVEYTLILAFVVGGMAILFATFGPSIVSRLNTACDQLTFANC
jgi:Flp pilus assembly pilin Flp